MKKDPAHYPHRPDHGLGCTYHLLKINPHYMNRFYLSIFLWLVLFGSLHAQQPEAAGSGNGFTLEQSVDYALKNSPMLQNALLEEEISRAKVKETTGLGLPQIDGKVQLSYDSKLRRFFSAYDPDGLLTGGESLPLDVGEVYSAENFFQLQGTGDAGISINQLLFSSSYLVGLRAAKTYRELSSKTTRQNREEVIQQVSRAYYTALINEARLDLYNHNIERVDSLLKNTSALFKNGFAEEIDVDRIQVQLNNLISERDNFQNQDALSRALLKFQMNYPQDQPIQLSDDIESITVDTNPDVYRADFDYAMRSDYSLLETQRSLQELNIKNKFSESMPTLSAFANMGYYTQSDNISGLFKTESDLGEDDIPGLGPDKWYPYMGFGVTLNVPIFSGLQRSARIQQAKLELQKIDNQFTSLKSNIDVEITQMTTQYKNALNTLKAQEANMKLAEKVARVTKVKYEQGVGSNMEVVDAENSLKQSQTNYYNALFEVLVAKVDLEKAYGRLSQPTGQE